MSDGLPTVKRERNADITRRALLDAAEAEFAAKGFDGARLQSIARAVGVQQALIHHYFDDKDGLYRAVIERGMAAVTAGSWSILGQQVPVREVGGTAGREHVRTLVTSLVGLLVDFYAAHTALLAILHHDAAAKVAAGLRCGFPDLQVLDAAVVVIEDLKRAGTLRQDVDPRHLCVSTLAMACLPFQDAKMFTVRGPRPTSGRRR